MLKFREWTFKVLCDVDPCDTICITGSCPQLGQWNPQSLLPLTVEENCREDNVWSLTLSLPREEVFYRYCVCSLVENKLHNEIIFVIKKWETVLTPRCVPISVNCSDNPSVEHFGSYRGSYSVDNGWLNQESVVQLKLYPSIIHDNPIVLWKRKHSSKVCWVKVIPIDIEKHKSLEPFVANGLEDSTEFDTTSLRGTSGSSWPCTEVAVMNEHDSKFHAQGQFGVKCDNNEFIIFQCHLLHYQSYAFVIDIYIEEPREDVPTYIGCSFVLPSNLKENMGVTSLPITSPKHNPIGQLTVHYLVVKPIENYNCDMSISYAHHWKESWKGLEVGHRGAGNSYHSHPKCCSNIRENTIASLKYAAENGADMVEFDVQLSCDGIPVIYHDFYTCIALKKKKAQDMHDLLKIPIKDLTLEQLQALKVFHLKENGGSKFMDEDFEDHQPFPTLEKALETVPESCGFNIEVKWTMQLIDGTYELQHPFELNHFLDLIIKPVLEQKGKRKIVFSCFHPDICTMIRLKQNKYPVLFLTGSGKKETVYEDIRTRGIHQAVLYALNADILGINVHNDDLLRDCKEIDNAFEKKLIVFCWGDDNCDQEVIKQLKRLGLHGIIYDKIDVYNTKETKESIFLCEERESMLKGASGSSCDNDSSLNGSETLVSLMFENPNLSLKETASSVI